MSKRVVIFGLANPKGLTHGGDARLKGLRDAIAANGYEVLVEAVGQSVIGESGGGLWRPLGRLKRTYLPLPLVRTRHLLRRYPPGHGEALILSTVPSLTYALARSGFPVDWADYFDLPYRFALAESTYRSGLAKTTAALQASHLRRLHHIAQNASRVETYAGYGDFAAASAMLDGSSGLWMPPVVKTPQVEARGDGAGRVAGFLANFDYWPNVDALSNLLENWLPSLRRGGFSVVVAGFGAPGLRPMPNGVKNLGVVSSVDEFYSSVDVVLVPVRRGSGIKVKAMEALLSGRPVLVDPHVLDGFDPMVRSSLEVFPAGLDESQIRIAGQGHQVGQAVRSVFSAERQAKLVGEILARLSGGRP